MTHAVRHDPANSRFEATIDGQQSVADYRRDGDVLVMTHTHVPPGLEGRGIAAAMVGAAFDYARAHRLKVDPQCAYVRHYMSRHPETQSLHV